MTVIIANYEVNKADLVWDPTAKVYLVKDMMYDRNNETIRGKNAVYIYLFISEWSRSGIWISIRRLDNMEDNPSSQKPAWMLLKAVMSFLLVL